MRKFIHHFIHYCSRCSANWLVIWTYYCLFITYTSQCRYYTLLITLYSYLSCYSIGKYFMLIIDILVYLAIYLSCYHYYFISLSFFIHTVNILTIIHILFITIISLHSFLHSSLVHSLLIYLYLYTYQLITYLYISIYIT